MTIELLLPKPKGYIKYIKTYIINNEIFEKNFVKL